MSKIKHSPGSWEYRPYFQDDENIAELRKHGLEPTRRLSNDGKAIVTARSGDDSKPIAHIECQTVFKRGQGHLADCAERDANARLIAAAPDMLAACKLALGLCVGPSGERQALEGAIAKADGSKD